MYKKITHYLQDLVIVQRISVGLSKGCAGMQARKIDLTAPLTWEFSGFSQNGEDGVLDVLISKLKKRDRYFIEIGSSDGVENNTAWLAIMAKYDGLMVEGSRASHLKSLRVAAKYNIGVKCVNKFVSKSNIIELRAVSQSWSPDVLSLDIDGNDYYIAQQLLDSGCRPKILVVEYNSAFGPTRAITIEYRDNFIANKAHASNLYYGVSIEGWKILLGKYGYKFVTVERNGVNAFFVLEGSMDEKFLSAICGLSYAENKSQLIRLGLHNDRQFSLIEHKKFVDIK